MIYIYIYDCIIRINDGYNMIYIYIWLCDHHYAQIKDLIVEQGADVGVYGVKFYINGRPDSDIYIYNISFIYFSDNKGRIQARDGHGSGPTAGPARTTRTERGRNRPSTRDVPQRDHVVVTLQQVPATADPGWWSQSIFLKSKWIK